uniref:UDP-glucose 4-epimerase n=1 Tax=Ciona intestinalis TaxID=7719 RepID=F6W2G3_CIOIN|nr:UDP-glucose 4-epimerase [Ciona intestinalis]XP_026690413.1 UDP-glucose 4-epimerase [Ciona intestinalis]|eukprot:XP_002127539.2 UDP-glucose 4-epimerase [Ciona intestinalis]
MTETCVLITGGAGFVGSHVVVELLEAGESVVVIDNLSNAASDKDNLPPAIKRIQNIVNASQRKRLYFRKGSYGDRNIMDSIFNEFKIKAVIHAGGFKAVGESKELPMKYYKNNVKEALTLVKAMNDHDVKNIIFSSSATVYAEVPPEKLPLTEESPVGNCSCPYASTKLFIENILRDVTVSDGQWKVMSLRYFNPVGAHHSGMIGEDPKGIPNNLMPFIAQVAVGRRKALNVFGSDYPTPDGTGVRDYVHVVDIAKGHVAALKALPNMKQGFQPINLGSGVGTSVLEMVQAFERASGVVIKTVMQDRRPGDVASMYCQPTLAFEELGWKTEKTVDEMCEDLWRFQNQNPNGLHPSGESN